LTADVASGYSTAGGLDYQGVVALDAVGGVAFGTQADLGGAIALASTMNAVPAAAVDAIISAAFAAAVGFDNPTDGYVPAGGGRPLLRRVQVY